VREERANRRSCLRATSNWSAAPGGEFERGDIATEVLDPSVCGYGAGGADAEGACHSRDDARAFIRRALADGVTPDCSTFATPARTRLVPILVRPRVPTEWGRRDPPGGLITLRNGASGPDAQQGRGARAGLGPNYRRIVASLVSGRNPPPAAHALPANGRAEQRRTRPQRRNARGHPRVVGRTPNGRSNIQG
jgi:hypothetical protein